MPWCLANADGGLDQLNPQVDLGDELLVQGQEGGVPQQERVDLLVQPRPLLRLVGNGPSRKVLRHEGCPLRDLLVAAIQPQIQGEAHRATDVEAGHRVMRQGVGALAVIVDAVGK